MRASPLPRRPRERLSLAEARRCALAAQGFCTRRPAGAAEVRHVRRVLDHVGLLQIDSVNVLVRSHYLPVYARLGPYPATLLERLAYGRARRLFEYWGHEASLLPLELHPLLRWRMERAAQGEGIYGRLAEFGRDRARYVRQVLAEVQARGPLSAGELGDGGRGTSAWWGWSEGKHALEWLFWAGHVTTAARRGFERVYDLTERVLPAHIVSAPTPAPADARRELLRVAARALGVATTRDLRDYFRLDATEAREHIAELAEAGDLLPVQVDGWRQPAWLWREARIPRRVRTCALLSPFDSLIWERQRTEALFGFSYRLELYTPAHKRRYGYYVLPFLAGERLVARVDLKADRAARCLRVPAVWAEPGAERRITADAVAGALAGALRDMAGWLGLDRVEVAGAGDLAAPLRHELAGTANDQR